MSSALTRERRTVVWPVQLRLSSSILRPQLTMDPLGFTGLALYVGESYAAQAMLIPKNRKPECGREQV